jgi:hypothetical protein
MTRAKWEPPIAFDRLQKMIEALQKARPMSKTMREEIADALDCFYVTLLVERQRHARGRPDAMETWLAAAIVRDLVELHGATVKAAVAVVSPRAGLNEKLARAYRKLKAGAGPTFMGRTNSELVAKYAARLSSGNK